ncbi:MAG: CCA tRNA nucleotidyltransferase [Planctomycetia bacterium]|nr:CCA tRNA nucleotidyltransferase [Planctomycetia bacterium]
MAADPKREFAVDVVRRLQGAGFRALWAGGCVRDLLLGKPPDDYDVATSARPEEVQTLFGPKRTLAIGASFGVILVHGPRRSPAGDVEVATFRTEGPYLDGRRPERVEFATAEEDARRRDFTINGMFYDPLAEQVFDYVGGQEDLARKVVRAIGDPAARFGEDKLRMLRAVRIVARFDFQLDPDTADAVQAMAPEILVVSQERIAQELKKMLVHPRRTQALELAHELKLLTVILPELTPVVATAALPAPQNRWQPTLHALRILPDPRFELALAATFYDLARDGTAEEAAIRAEQVCRRLKLSNDECHDVSWLVAHRGALAGAPGWPPHRLKRLLAERLIVELLALERACALARNEGLHDVEFCEQYLRTTPASEINPPPLITGDDLLAMGLVPGPKFKEILERVRDAQLDGLVTTRDEALEFARSLAKV